MRNRWYILDIQSISFCFSHISFIVSFTLFLGGLQSWWVLKWWILWHCASWYVYSTTAELKGHWRWCKHMWWWNPSHSKLFTDIISRKKHLLETFFHYMWSYLTWEKIWTNVMINAWLLNYTNFLQILYTYEGEKHSTWGSKVKHENHINKQSGFWSLWKEFKNKFSSLKWKWHILMSW